MDAPEILFSWCIRAVENFYSYKCSLRKVSWFCNISKFLHATPFSGLDYQPLLGKVARNPTPNSLVACVAGLSKKMFSREGSEAARECGEKTYGKETKLEGSAKDREEREGVRQHPFPQFPILAHPSPLLSIFFCLTQACSFARPLIRSLVSLFQAHCQWGRSEGSVGRGNERGLIEKEVATGEPPPSLSGPARSYVPRCFPIVPTDREPRIGYSLVQSPPSNGIETVATQANSLEERRLHSRKRRKSSLGDTLVPEFLIDFSRHEKR